MNKEQAARLITIALVLGGLVVLIARRNRTPEQTPQTAVYQMFDDARAGNTRAFLSRYTGQMQSVLKETAAEKGAAGFRDYLRSTNAEIKGLAVFDPKPVADGEVSIRVEYVYQNRNEAQTMYLTHKAEGWKIARVDGAERAPTLVPYGAPVQ